MLDTSLATSSRLFRFLVRVLAEGGAAIPAMGIQAIPEQIAIGLPKGSIRLNARVERLGHREVALPGGEVLRTRGVVVATDGPTMAKLTAGECPDPGARGATVLYYAAERAPLAEPILILDGEGRGPVNHLAVLSNASAALAPPGQALIAAGVVGVPDRDDAELDRAAREQLAGWFGAEFHRWRLLRAYPDPRALPHQTAGVLDPWQRTVRLRPGLYVCGMHRDNATLDGAMTSGFRAAQAVMEDIHAKLT